MSLLHPARTGTMVAIWMVDGVPARLVHDGQPYRVTDTPTRLEDENPDLMYRLNLSAFKARGRTASATCLMYAVTAISGD